MAAPGERVKLEQEQVYPKIRYNLILWGEKQKHFNAAPRYIISKEQSVLANPI